MSEETKAAAYADRLQAKQRVWWKRLAPVQLPYRWNLRRQKLGVTLDVGCGIGRNLPGLAAGSLGVDHNSVSVKYARSFGLPAMTVDEFKASDRAKPESFDGLLLAHLIEHLTPQQGLALLREYLRYLRPGGVLFIVCPQEAGYRSDPTHVVFADDAYLTSMCERAGLIVERSFSFPFPRWAGELFVYNEFCVRARRPV